jgi:Na+-transporting NADH:ubiquinone oxidoreductase subunit NqrE
MMKASLLHSSASIAITLVLWLFLSLALVGCANTVVYRHTTSVKTSAEEVDVSVLGFVSDIRVKDGLVVVSMTTEISITNEVE